MTQGELMMWIWGGWAVLLILAVVIAVVLSRRNWKK